MNRKNFITRSALLAFGVTAADQLLASITTSSVAKPAAGAATIINAGIGGNTTTNLLKRIDTDCLAHKPELVVMMIGTNDMVDGKHVAPDKFSTNLESLADMILKSGSKLLMLSILPFYEPYLLTRHPADFFQPNGATANRLVYNNIIQKTAEKKKASFFDIGSVFEKIGKVGLEPDSLIRNEANVGKTDGVHPTQNGYRFLGMAVSQFIQYNHLPTGRIVCFGDSITKGDGSIDKESYPAYMAKLLS